MTTSGCRLDGVHVDRLRSELRDAEEQGRPCSVSPMLLRVLLEALEVEGLQSRLCEVAEARAERAEQLTKVVRCDVLNGIGDILKRLDGLEGNLRSSHLEGG